MPEQPIDPRPHFVLTGTAKPEHFRSTRSPRSKSPPNLDRQTQGRTLLAQLTDLKARTKQITEMQRGAGIDAGFGIQVEFKSQPDVEMAFESLSRDRQGIERLNVRHEGAITYATVFIPEGKLETFEKIVGDYLAEKRSKDGKRSFDHKALIDTIQEIRAATFDALWTDDTSVLRIDEDLLIWWKIWLPVRENRQNILNRFKRIAIEIGFELSTKVIEFPERTVLHVKGSKRKLIQSMILLNNVTEIRCVKETAEFFDSLAPIEQHEWITDLLNRTTFTNVGVPYICLLDTGVNRGHPLLTTGVTNTDLHTGMRSSARTVEERAIALAARDMGVAHRAVNLRKGIRVLAGVYHIQNANAYHSRLKERMRRFHVVATKYLDHYLGWRRMIETFGEHLNSALRLTLSIGGYEQQHGLVT